MGVEILDGFCTKCGEKDLIESFSSINPTHSCHRIALDKRRNKMFERPLTEQDLKPFLPSQDVFKQKGTLHTGVRNEDAEKRPHYKMMENIPSELSDWTLLTTRKVYIQLLKSEEERFWKLFGEAGVLKPIGMEPVNLGKRGGKTKPGPVCAHLVMEIPTDQNILAPLNRKIDDKKHGFKIVKIKGEKLLKVYDLRFILKMIHDYGLPITHYLGKPRTVKRKS